MHEDGQEQIDLRTRRTHKLLQKTLIELVSEKGFDAITVGDIAERAMINRSTFYRHYQDKYDLAAKIFEEAVQKLYNAMPPLQSAQDVQEYLKSLDAEEPPEIVVRLFEHVAAYARLYRAILGKNGSTWFTVRISDCIVRLKREHGRPFLARNPGVKQKMGQMEVPLEMSTVIAVHLLIITIVLWLEGGEQHSPRSMAIWYHRFLMHGVDGYLRDGGLFDISRLTRSGDIHIPSSRQG